MLQSPVQKALTNYRFQSQTPHGLLVVQPLTNDWLQNTAELLSASFGDSMGYLPAYRCVHPLLIAACRHKAI